MNLKAKLDDHLNRVREFVLHEIEQLSDMPTKEWFVATIKNFYSTKKSASIPEKLTEYWNCSLQFKVDSIKPVSFRKWETVRDIVVRFENSVGKRFEIKDVNSDFVKAWIDFCKRENYQARTINRNFKNIKGVCKHAQSKY